MYTVYIIILKYYVYNAAQAKVHNVRTCIVHILYMTCNIDYLNMVTPPLQPTHHKHRYPYHHHHRSYHTGCYHWKRPVACNSDAL